MLPRGRVLLLQAPPAVTLLPQRNPLLELLFLLLDPLILLHPRLLKRLPLLRMPKIKLSIPIINRLLILNGRQLPNSGKGDGTLVMRALYPTGP
jgi:hypothetical protein